MVQLIGCGFAQVWRRKSRNDNNVVQRVTAKPSESRDLRVNPSDETIKLGPLAVRFLLTGENSSGSMAAFELVVPGGQRLAAPGIVTTTTRRRPMGSTEC